MCYKTILCIRLQSVHHPPNGAHPVAAEPVPHPHRHQRLPGIIHVHAIVYIECIYSVYIVYVCVYLLYVYVSVYLYLYLS